MMISLPHYNNNNQAAADDDSCLQREKWLGDEYLYEMNGFWLLARFVPGIRQVIRHFRPLPSDVILASFPKTGTTWLKSLLFSIINRPSSSSSSTHHHHQPLLINHPHELVPTLEVQLYGNNNLQCSAAAAPTTRIFSTHIPYQLLADNLNSSECRVVYVTRNPKDTLVSMWHFVNRWKIAEQEVLSIEEAIKKFCAGVFPCGPYYDHVLGYQKQSLERPNKIFFITYEELIADPTTQVQKLAEFLQCPFQGDDKHKHVSEVVRKCSFEMLSNYDVNKSEDFPTWFEVPYNSFFRQGKVGDHRNYLDPETIERIDAITQHKFLENGFTYGI